MGKETRVPSLTLRLFSTIMIGLLVMSGLTLFTTNFLKNSTRTNLLNEYQQVLTMYADVIEQQLTQAENRINTLGLSDTTLIGLSNEALHDDRQYEALRSQLEIKTQMQNWQIEYPMITGYYMYGADADVLIFQGNGYESSLWFDAQLHSNVTTFELQSEWQLLDSELGEILLYNIRRRDLCYGAWVLVDDVWSSLGRGGEEAAYFTFLAADGEEELPENTVQAEITNTELLIRQTLSEEALAMPAIVTVLQILSYVLLLLIPLTWFALHRLVIHPLKSLMKAIKEIDEGNTKYRIPEQSTSLEFDELNRRFNRSIEEVARAEASVYESQLETERVKIAYLTQQMQPHFVLNTLNLVYSMEASEYPIMIKTLMYLSRFYRYVAHITEPVVSLGAELDHVRNFFELQKIRYPGNFTYEICCEEELRDVLIPPIIIQTFAENAIKYSIVMGEANHVEVDIKREEDERIHIRIRDSGQGYSEEVLDKIHAFQDTGESQEGLGLGIQNTIQRLQLLYDAKAELIFGNAAEGGAQVDIYLPEMTPEQVRRLSAEHEGETV